MLHNPIVTAPIIGPRTVEQLDSAVRAAAIELDQATLVDGEVDTAQGVDDDVALAVVLGDSAQLYQRFLVGDHGAEFPRHRQRCT